MTDNNHGVTGVDLYSLWRLAHVTLPAVQKFYTDQSHAAHEIDAPNEQQFGRCHPEWATIFSELEQALFTTAATVEVTGQGLQRAIDEYSHVDGDNGKALNAAGKELEDRLNNPGLHDKDSE